MPLDHRLSAEVKHAEAMLSFLKKAIARGMNEKDDVLLSWDFEKIRKGRGAKRGRQEHVRPLI